MPPESPFFPRKRALRRPLGAVPPIFVSVSGASRCPLYPRKRIGTAQDKISIRAISKGGRFTAQALGNVRF
jgi:hypothetical protein